MAERWEPGFWDKVDDHVNVSAVKHALLAGFIVMVYVGIVGALVAGVIYVMTISIIGGFVTLLVVIFALTAGVYNLAMKDFG